MFDGVTGIVRKPIEGAQKEGVEGFFKGTNTLNIAVIENQLYNLLVKMFARFSRNRCEYILPSFLVSYKILSFICELPFSGIGKGLVGVVTRPTSGVIDFASSSFEGIKR